MTKNERRGSVRRFRGAETEEEEAEGREGVCARQASARPSTGHLQSFSLGRARAAKTPCRCSDSAHASLGAWRLAVCDLSHSFHPFQTPL